MERYQSIALRDVRDYRPRRLVLRSYGATYNRHNLNYEFRRLEDAVRFMAAFGFTRVVKTFFRKFQSGRENVYVYENSSGARAELNDTVYD